MRRRVGRNWNAPSQDRSEDGVRSRAGALTRIPSRPHRAAAQDSSTRLTEEDSYVLSGSLQTSLSNTAILDEYSHARLEDALYLVFVRTEAATPVCLPPTHAVDHVKVPLLYAGVDGHFDEWSPVGTELF